MRGVCEEPVSNPRGMNFWELCDQYSYYLLFLALFIILIVREVLLEKLP